MGMFTQRIALSNQDARQVSSTKLHRLGTVAETADGRVYRYCLAGGSILAAGLVNTSTARIANHTINSVATAVTGNTGVRQVNITLAGNTATTAAQYDDGFLTVIDSAGVGSAYLIAGTPVIAGSGTGIIQLAEQVMTSLTTSSKASLSYSPYGLAIVGAAAAALFSNGTNNVAVTASNYYWSQTGGIASVLSDGVIGKGSQAILSASVTGALVVEGTSAVTQRIGVAPDATVDTKYYPVFLTLE
jgi:hypothetical protein